MQKQRMLLIIDKYIEQSREKMSHSSPSQPLSHSLQMESSPRSQRKNSKRKRVKKERKQKTSRHYAPQVNQQINLQQFIADFRHQYFKDSLSECLSQLKNEYLTSLHIKSILGEDQNVYNVKDYQKSQELAEQYLTTVRTLKNGKLDRVGLKSRNGKMIVDFCRMRLKEGTDGKRRSLLLLKKNQALLLRRRKEIWKEIDDFLGKICKSFKENQHLDIIQREILTLCKLNTACQRSISTSLAKMEAGTRVKLDMLEENSASSVNDEYISFLILKNLRKSFDQQPLDILNYFQKVENYEINIHDDVPLKLLETQEELKEFLKIRRHRHRYGSSQDILRTCCAGCFGNVSEIYNPIENCNGCGMRMHLYCQKVNGKCQRCRYVRKTVEQKGQSQCCYLCKRAFDQGLLMHAFTLDGRQQYAHTFCLLINGRWKIEQETFKESIDIQNCLSSTCRLCQKSSNFHIKCQECSKEVHGLCAYLAGCSFMMDQDNHISVWCCGPEALKQRLSFQRKYRLNYDRMLYKKGSIFPSIQLSP